MDQKTYDSPTFADIRPIRLSLVTFFFWNLSIDQPRGIKKVYYTHTFKNLCTRCIQFWSNFDLPYMDKINIDDILDKDVLSFELKTHSEPNFWHFARFCFLPIIYSKGKISCVGSKRLHLLWKIRGHSETRHNVPGLSFSRSRFFQFSFNFLTLFHFQRLYPMTVIVFSRQCYLKKKEGENESLIQASTSIYHVHIYWPFRLGFAYWYRNYGSKISSAFTSYPIWNDSRLYFHLLIGNTIHIKS